jgi:hypothetical protein
MASYGLTFKQKLLFQNLFKGMKFLNTRFYMKKYFFKFLRILYFEQNLLLRWKNRRPEIILKFRFYQIKQ